MGLCVTASPRSEGILNYNSIYKENGTHSKTQHTAKVISPLSLHDTNQILMVLL